MNLEPEDKQALVQHRIQKAESSADEAKFLIDNDKLFAAVNRIYYANYYIVSALALKHGFSTSKHGQLIGWFNKTFIKEKNLEKRYSDILRETYEKRTEGDYKDFVTFTKEEVEKLFEDMKDFIGKIKELIIRNE